MTANVQCSCRSRLVNRGGFAGQGADRKTEMDSFVLARTLHVLALIHWIGGVWLLALVILPGLQAKVPRAQRLPVFEMIEGGFGRQARISTIVTGLTGLWMTYKLDAWHRFVDASYWWMHLMVVVWVLFTFVLYIAEPLVLHRWFHARAIADPETAFRLLQRVHYVLLVLSTIAAAGALIGIHGGL